MIYFIGGLQNREFKYFDTLKKIREENPGITESFFDADIKEEEKFLEKICFGASDRRCFRSGGGESLAYEA